VENTALNRSKIKKYPYVFFFVGGKGLLAKVLENNKMSWSENWPK